MMKLMTRGRGVFSFKQFNTVAGGALQATRLWSHGSTVGGRFRVIRAQKFHASASLSDTLVSRDGISDAFDSTLTKLYMCIEVISNRRGVGCRRVRDRAHEG